MLLSVEPPIRYMSHDYRPLLHPDDTRAAPGSLVAVQALVNTAEHGGGEDVLATPAAASAWLARAGLSEPPSRGDWERLVEAREALRTLLAVNAGLEGGDAAEAAAAALRARVEVQVGPDGAVTLRGEGDGSRRLVADALVAIHDAQVAGIWPRLKVCADPTCRWAFYDGSRNRAGAWCSMAECGNRAKARRFRSRRQASRSAQASQ
jgi:predicted RNA-binding Zn ribbon-like protein